MNFLTRLVAEFSYSFWLPQLYFGFNIPESLFDIDSNILNPKNSWDNQNDYENSAINLVRKFKKNYKKYDLGDDDILNGGPL